MLWRRIECRPHMPSVVAAYSCPSDAHTFEIIAMFVFYCFYMAFFVLSSHLSDSSCLVFFFCVVRTSHLNKRTRCPAGLIWTLRVASALQQQTLLSFLSICLPLRRTDFLATFYILLCHAF